MTTFSKAVLVDSVTKLIAKISTAVVKLVKTKLLPKAVEKQCKALDEASDKFIDKVGDLIDEYNNETDTKKKYRKLFLIELCANTMDAVVDAFAEASAQIKAGVDFSPLHSDDEEVKVALADIDSDDTPHCGEDGCAIV